MKMKLFLLLGLGLAAGTLNISGADANTTDERIEDAAQNSYVFKNYLKDDHITVRSQDGVVVLTGTVTEENHRSMAENTVESLPDVTRVDNQLQMTHQTADGNADTWLSVKVKAALLFHQNVSATKTKVYVKDGVVTLQGDAASEAQKDLTAEYASDVEGVKRVKNELTVVSDSGNTHSTMKEAIDDASITGQVKMTLMAHHSTSAIKTHVETKEGVVVLTGKAKNDAEKALVTKLVGDINGVKSITNNMEIE